MFDGYSASSIHVGIQAEAVGRLASSGRPLSQIAQELGIAASRLRAWRHKGQREPEMPISREGAGAFVSDRLAGAVRAGDDRSHVSRHAGYRLAQWLGS